MAKEIANDRCIDVKVYYDPEDAVWKAQAKFIRCESTDPSFAQRKTFELDLSGGTWQADVDALAAEALAQVKADEGIV